MWKSGVVSQRDSRECSSGSLNHIFFTVSFHHSGQTVWIKVCHHSKHSENLIISTGKYEDLWCLHFGVATIVDMSVHGQTKPHVMKPNLNLHCQISASWSIMTVSWSHISIQARMMDQLTSDLTMCHTPSTSYLYKAEMRLLERGWRRSVRPFVQISSFPWMAWRFDNRTEESIRVYLNWMGIYPYILQRFVKDQP